MRADLSSHCFPRGAGAAITMLCVGYSGTRSMSFRKLGIWAWAAISQTCQLSMSEASKRCSISRIGERPQRRGRGSFPGNHTVASMAVTPEDAVAQAKAAIAAGKPRAAVIQRLQQMGINPAGL